ncbi:MAG: hypothetical protein ACRCZH_06850 [Cetobacterium sp.]
MEFQTKQFRIPESISFKLKLYEEDIDATENSIVNELLEDFKIELSSNCEIKRVALDKGWEEDEQLEEKSEI